MRGFGNSNHDEKSAFTVEEATRDIIALLDKKKVDSFHLVHQLSTIPTP
jgi:pimeloyl-ACP methyl ester carboxylesterase